LLNAVLGCIYKSFQVKKKHQKQTPLLNLTSKLPHPLPTHIHGTAPITLLPSNLIILKLIFVILFYDNDTKKV